jgi:hypothetical protein
MALLLALRRLFQALRAALDLRWNPVLRGGDRHDHPHQDRFCYDRTAAFPYTALEEKIHDPEHPDYILGEFLSLGSTDPCRDQMGWRLLFIGEMDAELISRAFGQEQLGCL